MKKKILFFFLIFIVVLFGAGIVYFFYLNDSNLDNNVFLYEIVYYDEMIPGSKYDIVVYEDFVEVNATHFCSALDCEPTKAEPKIFSYSSQNMQKLNYFLENDLQLKKHEKNEIELLKLNEYEQNVLTSLYLNEFLFETAVEKYQYMFSYGESQEKEYHFYFKEDYSILVKVLNSNNDYDITGITTYEVNFSEENRNKLFQYAKEMTENNDGYPYHKSGVLYKNEKNIYLSLVKNDESYLVGEEIALLYEITYQGINCHTPYVRLYDDGTYEYFYTFSTDETSLLPNTGMYHEDIQQIINSVDKYAENNRGPFVIWDVINEIKYITYDTNVELMQFLNSNHLQLQQCLLQQD